MYLCPEDITIEMARIERRARAAVLAKLASRQLGEAWAGIEVAGRSGIEPEMYGVKGRRVTTSPSPNGG